MIILICVNLRSSVYICGKILTNNDNRQFDDIAPHPALSTQEALCYM
ncbi:hypothetical protein [Argonema galeatum]|nr:hypothetical protein [Argonema galeatum]MCL1466282.1 hypothetical protein [Argonema galeatum A003/A1]